MVGVRVGDKVSVVCVTSNRSDQKGKFEDL